MLKKLLKDTRLSPTEAQPHAHMMAKRFESVEDLIERCETISHKVANKSGPMSRIAA